jgi:hypothetical protein
MAVELKEKWVVNGKEFEKDELIQYIEKENPIKDEYKQDGYLRNGDPKNNSGMVYIMGFAPNLEEGKCVITTRDRLFKIE